MGAISPRASSMAWKAGSWRGRMASRATTPAASAARKTSSACASVAQKGFSTMTCLPPGDAGKGLLVVKRVRAADIDGVDVGGCRKLIE